MSEQIECPSCAGTQSGRCNVKIKGGENLYNSMWVSL